MSTKMRMEAARLGIFDLALSLVTSPSNLIQHYARELLISIW
jgi:hypothetical protein